MSLAGKIFGAIALIFCIAIFAMFLLGVGQDAHAKAKEQGANEELATNHGILVVVGVIAVLFIIGRCIPLGKDL